EVSQPRYLGKCALLLSVAALASCAASEGSPRTEGRALTEWNLPVVNGNPIAAIPATLSETVNRAPIPGQAADTGCANCSFTNGLDASGSHTGGDIAEVLPPSLQGGENGIRTALMSLYTQAQDKLTDSTADNITDTLNDIKLAFEFIPGASVTRKKPV